MRFFCDVYPGMDRSTIIWYTEADAARVHTVEGAKRLWMEVAVPTEQQLWPDHYEGEEVDVTPLGHE